MRVGIQADANDRRECRTTSTMASLGSVISRTSRDLGRPVTDQFNLSRGALVAASIAQLAGRMVEVAGQPTTEFADCRARRWRAWQLTGGEPQVPRRRRRH